jgi:hypothetical protein
VNTGDSSPRTAQMCCTTTGKGESIIAATICSESCNPRVWSPGAYDTPLETGRRRASRIILGQTVAGILDGVQRIGDAVSGRLVGDSGPATGANMVAGSDGRVAGCSRALNVGL